MSRFIVVAGEKISIKEAMELIEMLRNDAKQIAGEFHGMERSEKFRANWPNEYDFAESEWKNFVEPCRMMYAERLGDPKTPPADQRRMYLALLLQAEMGKGQETDNRLQIAPNTQQFEGDKRENRLIMEKFTGRQNLRAVLRNGATKFARMMH